MFTCATDLQCDAAKPPTSRAHHRDAHQPIAVPKAPPATRPVAHNPAPLPRLQNLSEPPIDIANVKLETPGPAAESFSRLTEATKDQVPQYLCFSNTFVFDYFSNSQYLSHFKYCVPL